MNHSEMILLHMRVHHDHHLLGVTQGDQDVIWGYAGSSDVIWGYAGSLYIISGNMGRSVGDRSSR